VVAWHHDKMMKVVAAAACGDGVIIIPFTRIVSFNFLLQPKCDEDESTFHTDNYMDKISLDKL
jgi:hypothetical protein